MQSSAIMKRTELSWANIMSDQKSSTLLLVDDEVSILNALRRVFYTIGLPSNNCPPWRGSIRDIAGRI